MTTEQILSLTSGEATPAYIFDLGELEKRISYLRRSIPSEIELCYAVKANTFIIEKACELVDYLEICSPGEYRICEKLSCPHGKYVISGVNKQEDFIGELVSEKDPIAVFTAESKHQFFLLREAAKKQMVLANTSDAKNASVTDADEMGASDADDLSASGAEGAEGISGRRLPVLIRLTSGTQFGLDKADLFDVISEYKDDPFIDIIGIQYFSGTQKNSLKKLKRELDYVDEVIKELRDRFSFETRKLEYGTGFPVSYFEGESFDEDTFMKEFSDLLSGMAFKGKITLEIGRSIAASCGTYLTKVVDTKFNCGERYAIVDGGMHQIVYYGQFMAMKHPKIRRLAALEAAAGAGNAGSEETAGSAAGAEAANNTDIAEPCDWNICGSLCTINDFLVKKYPFGDLKIGDILAFEDAGAYCPTEGISLFLSRELPSVFLLDGSGAFTKVREQIQTEQFNSPGPVGRG